MAKGGSRGDSATGGGTPTADGLIADPQKAMAEAAIKQSKLGEEWLKFSKDQFAISQQRQAELDTIIKPLIQKQIGYADEQAGWARADRERYDTVYKPVEDSFIAEASNYGSAERQEEAAAEAKADVQRSLADARETSIRQSSAMGINPNSGRFAGIDRSVELSGALATAGAANTARTAVRDKGLALKGEVANMGRNLPSQASSLLASSVNTGNAAAGLGLSNQQTANSASGIVQSGYSGASQGYANMGQMASSLGNQQSSDQAGIWGAIGSVAGAALPLIFSSSEELKEDKVPLAEGEGLDAINEMPVEEWTYKEGEGDGGRHIGTYAEDFTAATGRGDGKTINAQDAIGVTMKAVQDLSAKVTRIEKAVGITPPAGKKPQAAGLKMAA